jgi:hypothetical protein
MKNYYNEEILKLISNNILNFNIEELKGIYSEFENGRNSTEKHPNINLSRVMSPYKDGMTGACVSKRQFDLPYFIKSYINTDKTVVILGMDAKSQYKKEDVLLSSPYDFHFDCPKEYSSIIEALRKHYNVYLTDLYKGYWVEDCNENGDVLRNKKNELVEIPSNTNKEYIKKTLHADLLEKEFNIFSHKMIGVLAWGDKAKSAILKIYNEPSRFSISKENLNPYILGKTNRFKLIPTVHPSNLAASWKDVFSNNNNLGEKWDSKIIAKAVINALKE